MRKNLVYLFALICSMTLCVSCSDDDDEVKLPIDTDIAGIYKGDLKVTVDDAEMPPVPQRITLSKSTKGENRIALSLKNFSFLGQPVGNIEVDPCTVKPINGGYSFEGQQTLTLMAPIGTCPVTVTGTVKGDKMDIQIGVRVEAMNQDVKVAFAGTKLTGNEKSEAKIISFTFDNEIVTEQPVIDEANGTITFRVNDIATDEQLKLAPTITISDKATISPATGVVQDFSNGNKVEYTVVSEDYSTVKTYKVAIEGKDNVLFDTYTGKLNVLLTIPDEGDTQLESFESVELTRANDGGTNFSFVLKNFILGEGEDMSPIGNIKIDDIELIPAGGNKYTFSKNIDNLTIAAGDKEGVEFWLGPLLVLMYPSGVPVDLKGTIEGENITVDLTISLEDMMDIAVKFTGVKQENSN